MGGLTAEQSPAWALDRGSVVGRPADEERHLERRAERGRVSGRREHVLVRGGRGEERVAAERRRRERRVLLAHALEVVEQQEGVAEVDLHALHVDRDELKAGLVEELAAVREARGGRAPRRDAARSLLLGRREACARAAALAPGRRLSMPLPRAGRRQYCSSPSVPAPASAPMKTPSGRSTRRTSRSAPGRSFTQCRLPELRTASKLASSNGSVGLALRSRATRSVSRALRSNSASFMPRPATRPSSRPSGKCEIQLEQMSSTSEFGEISCA